MTASIASLCRPYEEVGNTGPSSRPTDTCPPYIPTDDVEKYASRRPVRWQSTIDRYTSSASRSKSAWAAP
jgi:hypothetical protein